MITVAKRYLESLMKKTKTLQNGNNTCTATTHAQVIKLGLDVHADSIVIVRIVDGQTPQPAQRLSPEKFLAWVPKQLALAEKVYACYEAGPLGYSLQRSLTALGIVCYVVRPRATGMSTARASRPTVGMLTNWPCKTTSNVWPRRAAVTPSTTVSG